MPRKGLSMRKVREVLRLHFGAQLSARKIALSCNIARSTVGEYISRAMNAGLTWPLPDDVDDARLEAALFRAPEYSTDRPIPDIAYLHTEMRKKGVTLQLLWQEYKQAQPDGYQYTQFCQHYRRSVKKLGLVLRQEHRAGEKMFVDWAGATVPVIDRNTGEINQASIFVTVLGASNYTYAEATLDKTLPNWILAHIRAFEAFHGAPEVVVVDNLKTGVKNPCRYEPDLNPVYLDLATHYGTVVIPTRVRKPRDNAKVEVGVQVVERWVLAALRNRTFFSVAELNQAIRDLVQKLSQRKFKKLDSSRLELYEKLDRPALRRLPAERYAFLDWRVARVGIDYHIEVNRHFYSVPYQLTGEQVDVRLGPNVLEVLYKNRRVASHVRSHVPGRATTSPEHRPKAHQRHLEWTPSQGSSIGPLTHVLPPQNWLRPSWLQSHTPNRATVAASGSSD